MPKSPPAPSSCAQCGASIPPKALACPGCGADENTGWREQSIYDGLDLPEETPTPAALKRSERKRGVNVIWRVVALLLLVLLVLSTFGIAF